MLNNYEITSLSIIGAGNVGWHLAHAFNRAGITVKYIFSRSSERAEELAKQVGAKATTSLNDLRDGDELLIISTSDDAIVEVVAKLGNTPGGMVHTAGSVGMEAFSGIDAPYGVLYPLQTFTRGSSMDYDRIPFMIEASTHPFQASLVQLAGRVTSHVRILDSASRLKLHIAAVFACNFGNHMAVLAERILNESGTGFDVLLPLLEQTFNKLKHMKPPDAQTGPASRGDHGTMEKHLSALENDEELRELYDILSKSVMRNKKIQ